MHDVDVELLLQTVEQGTADPAVLRQPVELRERVELRALRGVITTEVVYCLRNPIDLVTTVSQQAAG